MATFRKRGERWRAELCVNGVRDGGTFDTKAEAKEWAARREVEIRETVRNPSKAHTVDQLFQKYAAEVSAKKPGKRWEQIRLDAIAETRLHGKRLGDMLLCDVTATTIASYRDHRLKTVTGSTVNREFNLLSHTFTVARDEWRWITESPTRKVKRPKEAAPRDRLITDKEIELITYALGYTGGVETVSQRVAAAFLFAIETAMRCGEICGLRREHVAGAVATLPMTKNGSARHVPLSKRAREILESLPEADSGLYFDITTAQVDALFRKARGSAGIEGIVFHDTRHLAITRLAKKLTVLELARMVGHRDLRQLQVYYNETAESLAQRLD